MSWILSDPRVSDRPGGSDFLDLAELRAWAGRHNFLMLVEALPEAASGPRIQRAMLPSYIQNHVNKTIGDDLAESLITAEPEKYANSDQRMCEAAPAWVYACELAGRIDASIQAAIDQGEIIPFDAAGMPKLSRQAVSGETASAEDANQDAPVQETAPNEHAGAPSAQDKEAEIAALFDPTGVPALEVMFPDGGKWKDYAERAATNGLKAAAKVGRGKFNPYLAARWWLDRKAPNTWDLGKCLRKLANNLPPRSCDSKHMLIGDYD